MDGFINQWREKKDMKDQRNSLRKVVYSNSFVRTSFPSCVVISNHSNATQYATTLSPSIPYDSTPELPLPLVPTPDEVSLLTTLVNPAYMNPATLDLLRSQFIESSQLVLADFLRKEIAEELELLLREEELTSEANRRGQVVANRRVNRIRDHSNGESSGWEVIGPPHIQRFCSLPSPSSSSDPSRLITLLHQIQHLFTTIAFRSFLAALTSLLPTAHTTQVRRFRPGLDYTLARGEPESGGDPRLDLGLCLTPVSKEVKDVETWESGEVGGWELWLAGEEGGDEATYGAVAVTAEEEDDGPLLSLEPGWNRLHLVLRDPGVLKFVKYVSARAPGSRFDVSGEFEVSAVEEEEEEETES